MIYIQSTGEPSLFETGHFLGSVTPELKPGFHIEEFVSGGPKNYAYRIVDPVTGNREMVSKFRIKKLNYSATKTVNFDVIKALILREDNTETMTVHTNSKIKRKRAYGRINSHRAREYDLQILT